MRTHKVERLNGEAGVFYHCKVCGAVSAYESALDGVCNGRRHCPLCREQWTNIVQIGVRYYFWHWCQGNGAIAWDDYVHFDITRLVADE